MTTHQRKALMPQDHGSAAPMLSGLRVLEIGHFIAAPFCTRLLGDLGADVIKIEPPAGDPARQWGEMVNGRSLWWSMHGRSEEHTSELQSLMRISYAVFCLKKKK